MRPHPTNYSESAHAALAIPCSPPSRCSDGNPTEAQTPDHWGLFVSGFVLFLLPWLGAGFAPDPGAAWTAWVVGFVAVALGAIGWLNDRPPTVSGINENTSSQTRPSAVARWISRAALVVGPVTVVLGATVVQSSPAAVAVTIGKRRVHGLPGALLVNPFALTWDAVKASARPDAAPPTERAAAASDVLPPSNGSMISA